MFKYDLLYLKNKLSLSSLSNYKHYLYNIGIYIYILLGKYIVNIDGAHRNEMKNVTIPFNLRTHAFLVCLFACFFSRFVLEL